MNQPPDIVALLVALMAVITTDTMAQQLGPYFAIALLAAGGALIALSGRHDDMSTFQSLRFVLVRVLIALVLTVSVAQGVARIWPAIEPRYSLVPIALLIGWVRDYNAVLSWIGAKIAGLFGRKIDNA